MNKITFMQTDLSRGGSERQVAVLANYFVENGLDVDIALFQNNEIAYDLDDRINVVFINEDKYLFEGVFPKIQNNIRKVLFQVFVLFPAHIIAYMKIKVLKKSSNLYIRLFQQYEFDEKVRRCIVKYIANNQDRIIISLTNSTIMQVTEALQNTKHGPIIIMEAADPSWGVTSEFEEKRNRSYEQADICVFQTPGALSCFQEVIQKKGVVIPNPVMKGIPEPWQGQRKKAIVNFCRLDPVKNLDLLIDAFNLLHLEYPNFELYIYGDEPTYLLHLHYKEALLKKIKELNIENYVHILPARNDIHELIKDFAMYVSSSDHEGLSNSMIEAMALGLPVICTDCPSGGAAYVIKNYENGILTSVGNTDELFKAMRYIIEHPNEAEQMANKATMIKERLSVNTICAEWLDLFN